MKINYKFWLVAILLISLSINFLTIKKLYHLYLISKNNLEYKDYQYLSPHIFTQNQNDTIINFIDLRDQLKKLIGDNERQSIYFEYLPSGTTIGINEKRSFLLASLLKVPLVMAVYKEIELGRMNLNQTLTLKEDTINSDFGTVWKKGINSRLTLKDAIYFTLIESDNTAKNVILDALGHESLERVFNSLDIPSDLENKTAFVTPKNYTSILKSLYLSSYVSKKSSNEILNFLTKTKFDDKIVAGVPNNIRVAHKIGVYESKDKNDSIYTDCGIVYIPKRPYIICSMIQSDLETAQKFMKDISSIIYQYVSTQ